MSKLLVALGRGVTDLLRPPSPAAVRRRAARTPPARGAAPAAPAQQETGAPAPAPAVPATWREAKAISPGLLSYAQAKAADPGVTIIDHLRDVGRGWLMIARSTLRRFWPRMVTAAPHG